MALLRLHKGRMVLSGVFSAPPEALCPTKLRKGGWSFPVCGDVYRRLAALYGTMQVDGSLKDAFREIKAGQDLLLAIAESSDWDGRVDLLDYQRVGVAWMVAAERCLLADDRGCGKTVQAVVAGAALNPSHAVVVAPTAMAGTWAEHIDYWAGRECLILSGSAHERQAIFERWYEDGGWLVCNSDVLHIHEADFIRAHPDLIVVDEAHFLRNGRLPKPTPSGKKLRGEAFTTLCKLAKRTRGLFLLTGTPKVNSDADWWPLLHLIDPQRFGSYWSFVFRFLEVDDSGYGMKVGQIRPGEVENLSRLLKPYALRRSKPPGLPEMRNRRIQVTLEGVQETLYRAMETDSSATLGDQTVDADAVVAQITRLRQLVLDPKAVFPDYEGPNAKLDALLGYLAEHDDKVVVFTNFATVVDRYAAELNAKGIETVTIHGGVKNRQAAKDALQKGSARVLVATMKTGGEGLTLTAANRVVILDPSWHPAGNEQSIDRVLRIGQTAEFVETVIIDAPGTVEDFVWQTVRTKGHVTVSDVLGYLRDRKRGEV